ncbi:putative DsbA family dithiol-disulfide isomerase [Deinococcus sp. HSC-46F16]|uniref:DsbA family oxidoreductase n=1 Tax=Deinococcus sp. HSC-46F16 TaxID=2910968 RepID=UPI0020A08B49|nr:DsbA family protein [Deinococcus sp. HSC-46F16]MCP2015205.1 putative DsbA family dithiol-disulfide isomerase [Deinococcus sp. HSC-46F16]
MTASPSGTTEVFFDFLCPYAWRGVELAAVLRGEGETFKLRHFSLTQGNHPENAGQAAPVWWLTDQPLGEGDRFQQASLPAFLSAQAAARQGEEQAWAYTLALYRAHHEGKQPLEEATFVQAARDAGLDLDRWEADRQDEAGLRASLRADLADAAEIGVFGTPTFVLPDGSAAYYRFENLTRDPDTARQWWALYGEVLNAGAGIATIKRAKNRPANKA